MLSPISKIVLVYKSKYDTTILITLTVTAATLRSEHIRLFAKFFMYFDNGKQHTKPAIKRKKLDVNWLVDAMS